MGQADIGAYEYQGMVNTTNIREDGKNLTLIPNPVAYKTTLTIENEWLGAFTLQIVDVQGKLLETQQLNKSYPSQNFVLRVDLLPKGALYLILDNGDEIISKRMIKL